MKREDDREKNQIRDTRIVRNYIPHAEGSALITVGKTVVICTASVEERVPSWLTESGQGWVTAQYGMLPRATHTRSKRESQIGRPGGRTQEIQRLIGRSLRSIVDMKAFPDYTIYIDADVLKADGGTRTAAITGSFVALYDALRFLKKERKISDIPINDFVAATSVGVINDEIMVDLNYGEDSNAQVDMNIVMTGNGDFVEVQGTAEKNPFNQEQLEKMLEFASSSIKQLIKIQKQSLKI